MGDLYSTYAAALQGQSYPLIFLDLDKLAANARAISAKAGKKPIRIASKSIRSLWVLRHILELDQNFKGVMTFSVGESFWLAEKGFKDILVGYPCLEPEGFNHAEEFLRKLKVSHEQGSTIECPVTFMVCSEEHLEPLERLAKLTATQIPVCIDIDQSLALPGLHFGVRRSRIRNVESAIELVRRIAINPDLKLAGFMGYEAQIAGVPDRDPANWLQNGAIVLLKKISENRIRSFRKQLLTALRKEFESSSGDLMFNGGGTGSLSVAMQDESLTEVTAGSGFYAPGLFDHYGSLSLEPALGFGLRVTRIPAPGWVTCHGGGYIASGSTGNNKLPKPYLPPGLRFSPLEGAGEVQTPLTGATNDLHIGDPVFFRHAKAGEICERFNEIHLIRSSKHIGTVKTYRGEGQSFL